MGCSKDPRSPPPPDRRPGLRAWRIGPRRRRIGLEAEGIASRAGPALEGLPSGSCRAAGAGVSEPGQIVRRRSGSVSPVADARSLARSARRRWLALAPGSGEARALFPPRRAGRSPVPRPTAGLGVRSVSAWCVRSVLRRAGPYSISTARAPRFWPAFAVQDQARTTPGTSRSVRRRRPPRRLASGKSAAVAREWRRARGCRGG
jgi:hypothetical protein